VASLSQGRTAAAQCGLFTYKSVPVIFEPPCTTFLIYKSDTVNELSVHNFIFQHSRRHCPNIYYVFEPASVSPSHRSLPPALWTKEIKDGLPLLCSSWTSVLPSDNSRYHFVTFCRFITLP